MRSVVDTYAPKYTETVFSGTNRTNHLISTLEKYTVFDGGRQFSEDLFYALSYFSRNSSIPRGSEETHRNANV